MKRQGIILLGFVIGAVCLLAPSTVAAQTPTGVFVLEPRGFFLPHNLENLIEDAGGTLHRRHREIQIAVAQSDSPTFCEDLMATTRRLRHCTQDFLAQWLPVVPGLPPMPSSSSSSLNTEVQSLGSGVDLIGDPSVGDFAIQASSFEAEVGKDEFSDPTQSVLFNCQWYLPQIDAEGAWNQGEFGSADVKIAFLDSGIDPAHQEFVGKVDLENSTSTVTAGSSPCDAVGIPDEDNFLDLNNHGSSHINVATSNNVVVSGVAPRTELVAIKVVNCLGTGYFSDILAGLLHAANLRDVEIILMTLEERFEETDQVLKLKRALDRAAFYATIRGKLLVAPAGDNPSPSLNLDEDDGFVSLPAELATTMAVSGVAIDGERAANSSFGLRKVWMSAPSGSANLGDQFIPNCQLPPSIQENVLGACASTQLVLGFPCGVDNYVRLASTNIAASLVAGVASIMDAKADGRLRGGFLRWKLARTAEDLGDPGPDSTFARGQLDASAAVAATPDLR